MNKYTIIKMVGYCFLIFSLGIFQVSCQKNKKIIGYNDLLYNSPGIFQVSCQKNKEFIGYNDLLYNSPSLLWGSSIEEVKNKYPNIEKRGFNGYDDIKNNLTGQIQSRFFRFYDNQLYMVLINYGTYNDAELDLLKNNLQIKYGKYLIEDNGTIENWYIADNENNAITFVINKIENNTVRCSYINPKLRDEYDKKYKNNGNGI